jgi:hypothetical protein
MPLAGSFPPYGERGRRQAVSGPGEVSSSPVTAAPRTLAGSAPDGRRPLPAWGGSRWPTPSIQLEGMRDAGSAGGSTTSGAGCFSNSQNHSPADPKRTTKAIPVLRAPQAQSVQQVQKVQQVQQVPEGGLDPLTRLRRKILNGAPLAIGRGRTWLIKRSMQRKLRSSDSALQRLCPWAWCNWASPAGLAG